MKNPFCLKPFKTFVNPSSPLYEWVGLGEHEAAYLNDFRYSQVCIKWSDFLLLLEEHAVNLYRPRNQFSTDLKIPGENTIPFFATSKSPLEYLGKYNMRDERETERMASRWKVFTFHAQIPSEKVKNLVPCPYCFATLTKQGSEMDD